MTITQNIQATQNILATPILSTDTQVDEKIDRSEKAVSPSGGNGDHDRFAHYVNKVQLTKSAVTGKAVTALCGKRWVPTRDAQKYPVCPTCRDIYGKLKN